MTPSDELFHLIKSLTPSEKRYFKVHASRHVIGKSNNYVKLFDALDALPDDKEYDEAAFKKSLRGKSYGKHLSDEKTHLREMLLRAMRLYHADRTPQGRLVEMIHEINFLYSKGFVKNCQHQIDKAFRLAAETEQYTEMLVLNDFLVRLYRENPTMAPYNSAVMEQRERDILDRIVLTREAVYLSVKMIEVQNSLQWAQREPEALGYMNRATELALRHDLPTRASVALLGVRQRYLIHHRRYLESLTISIDWLHQQETQCRDLEVMTDSYRVILSNYMMCAMQCERFDLLPEAIQKLKTCKVNYKKEEADSFRLSTQYELIYLLNSADRKDADEILHRVELGLKKYERFIPADQAVNFRFNVSLLYFLEKEYDECLRQLQSLYTISGREKRYEYTTTLARVMEWMCQSSIGNYIILDTSLRGLRRLFAEKGISGAFVEQLFVIYSAIIKSGNNRSRDLTTARSKLLATEPPTEWRQLHAIIATWL